MYYVDVLQNVANSEDFYIGYTSDPRRRLDPHNDGENRSTKGRRWRVAYDEAYLTDAAARERERRLKHDGRVRRFRMERLNRGL